MKRSLLSALAGLLMLVSAPDALALTKEDVVNMSNIGVADTVIISAIQASGTVFELSADDIIQLTRAGVSQSVIEAMQKTRQAAPPPAQPAPTRQAPAQPTPAQPATQPAPVRQAEPEKQPAPEQAAPERTAPPRTQTAPPRTQAEPDRSKLNAPAQVKPLPADVKQLKRRYDTGKYTSAAAMAFDLLTGPNKERYNDSRSTVYYYLGKSLYKLGYYHAAHDIFLKVAEDGPAGPHYNGCLSLLTRTSEHLKEYQGFTRVLEGTSSKDLPRRVKSTLLYLIGLSRYEQEDFEDARRALEGVSNGSEFYSQARFLEGMAMYRQGDSRQAVRTFRSLVEARDLVGNADEITDIRDLSLLNMARVYYRVEDFSRAEQLYDLVPRESRYWPQALFEQAYTNFWQGDYNIALGQLLTIESPFFKGRAYIPEAKILETLIYYNLCEYDRVERLLKEYHAHYTPVRDAIRAFLKENAEVIKGSLDDFHKDQKAMKTAVAAYTTLFEPAKKKKAMNIPPEILVAVEGQRDFKNLHHHLGALRQEMELLKDGKTGWKGTALGNTLVQKLEEDEQKLRADAGRFLLEQLSRIEKEISGLIGQSQIIQVEVVRAQKEEFEDKFRNPEFVETYDKLEQSYATEASFIYWPFTGEFWKDELGYYRFTERGSCGTR